MLQGLRPHCPVILPCLALHARAPFPSRLTDADKDVSL
jgi:hypothetical protein